MKYFFFLVVGLVQWENSIAQNALPDTSIHLREAVIISSRLTDFSTGTKIQKFDSATLSGYQNGNLSDLLSSESPVFIKSYGLGSLASSSFRGGNASHTAILWNGFNLNNPMYGQTDLSLIPMHFFNDVSMQFGGTGSLWGSGAVGGSIHLNNQANFDKGTTLSLGGFYGSFQQTGTNAQIEISKKRWISNLKFFYTAAKNDFEFHNTSISESPLQKQQNAELKAYGIISENHFLINEKQRLNILLWYQNNDRNLPPVMSQSESNANQKDENYRITTQWQRNDKKVNLSAKMAFFNENLTYSDSVNAPPSISLSNNFIAETEANRTFKEQHFFNAGINSTIVRGESDGYPERKNQNRVSLFASYKFKSKNGKYFSSLSTRQEWVKEFNAPLTFSFGNEYFLSDWLRLKSSISKNYRIPTLNDLYWTPGGNSRLLPESGYSMEAGTEMNFKSEKSKIHLFIEVTVFNRKMENWIIWLPSQNYWVPQNIMEVWSRGMETKNELSWSRKKVKFKTSVITNYVVSTNEKPKSENDASVGKQLIYVPMYSGHFKFTVEYKNISLSYGHHYTGYRYTSSDNLSYLTPFTLGNIYANYRFLLKNINMNVYFKIDNLYNENYQVMQSRTMPMRNYQIGILLKLNKPNANKSTL